MTSAPFPKQMNECICRAVRQQRQRQVAIIFVTGVRDVIPRH